VEANHQAVNRQGIIIAVYLFIFGIGRPGKATKRREADMLTMTVQRPASSVHPAILPS